LPLSAFALGLPIGALTTNILVIDDIRDREFDVVKGKRTVAVRFGKEWSRAEFMVLLALSYLAPLWFLLGFGFGAWILLPLLTIPYALTTARAVLTLDRFQDLVPLTPKAGRLLLAYALLLAIGSALA
jgi:1,4-dihydroxy-2-naphthoate octaprenyltransferase